MGLLSSVKKAFGGGSKKKEKKKQKPQKKTYIQNTNVGKKATQVNNKRAVNTRQTGGHAVQRRPQATTRGGVARGNKPKAPARVNRSVGQKPSVRPTGGGQSRPVQTTNRRGNALNTGSYGNVRINQNARNRSQTNGIQPRQRQLSNPVSRNPVQNVRNFERGFKNAWNDVSGKKAKPQVQGPPKFSSGYKPPISDDWIDRGYRNVSIGPNVQRDRSQVNGVQRRKPINNPSTGNPVRDFQNSVNNIWKEAGKAAPKTFQDFSKEWKASGSGQRDYKTVTTHGRTTPSGTTVEVMPKDLKVGDRVVTTQGTVTITGKKSGAGKALKDLDNAYDQAMTRYASAYNSGNQSEMSRAENDIRNISNQMLNARYTFDSSQTDYTQQNAAYETIDKAQKAWEKANKKGDEKGMAAAHKRAEKARANLGFSGGEAGNEYLPFNKPVQQRTDSLSFGERFRGARDYANTQAKAREDRKYVGDVNTYNQAVQQYENSGYAGHVAGRRNQGQMKSSAMNKTGPSGGTANPTGGSYNAKLDAIQKNISERDRFVYNYLYSTQGKKAADNFLDAAWNVNISQTAANRANEQLSDWAKAHPVAATVTSTMMQPFNTMAGAGQMVNNAVTGQKADPYFSAIGNSTNTQRESVRSTIKSTPGQWAYDAGTNIADMVLDTMLGGTIGGAARSGASATARLAARRGIVGSAFKKVANNKVANKAIDKLLSSSAVTTGLMSTQSAYSTYVQSVNSGVATDVALSNAVANGALEFLSEMPAVENLFSLGKLGRMGGEPISNAKDFAKKLGAQMGIEAGGEAFANLTQTAADSVLMGSRSQVAQQAAEYEGQGMSPEEALKQARIDSYFTQTWQSAAQGALVGGIMGGGAMGVGTVRTGQYIRGNSDFSRDLATVYQTELGDGKYKNVADTILSAQEGEAPVRVGVVKAANMKGELAKHFSDQLNDPSMKEYLYNYVGLDVPNSRTQQMKDIFAEYLGRDTGYASKEFSDAWLRVSRDMEMNLALYRQTHDPQLREALEEYLDNATMLLYSGELNDAAETTSIVRAEVNAELNGINANAGGNAVVSEDIDTVVEQGQVNEEGDPVEEATLQEETPVAPEDQQAVQQEAETIGDVVEGVADESGVDVQTQAVSSTAFNPEGEQAVAGTTAPTAGTTAGTTSGTNGTISSGGATVTEVPPQTGSTTEGTVSQIGTTGQQAGTQTQFEPTDSYPVGQKDGGNVTYHRSAGNPTGRINAARNIMRSNGLSVDSYDVISENDNGTVTFINAKDFDTATEPVILNKVVVDLNDGSIRNETSGTEIIPEKSRLVPADYSGFDVDAQRAREDSWRKQSGIRFNTTRLNDKAYFEETFGDYLRQQEGANNDTERYEETGTSRDTAEREPVSSTEGEGRTEEVRGENSGEIVSDLPEESEPVPVSGRESTGDGTDSTEQSSSRNESDIVEEDENTLEEAIDEELTEDNVSFEERSEEESEEESEEPANLMDGAIISSEVTEVFAPSDNNPIRVRYAIVPVESLIASNDPSGQINPDYPSELQPRDRTRQATQDQIVTTLGHLNPNKLLDNKMNAADGAPIVRSDGVVVSGNMRTMTLTRMYETNQEKSDDYKETVLGRAEELNIDVSEAPEHPVLVGITETNDIDELVDLSRRLNTQSTAAFSATEQAFTDASKMDASLVDEMVPFEKNLSVSNNQKFIYDFINDIVPESEKSGMINSNGELSKSGRERIEYAIFAYGYEDAELVERLSESLDDNAKNITNSLMYSAGKAAKYRNLVSEGRVADNQLTESILNAVNIYLRAKANGFTVSEYLSQGQIAIGEDGSAIDVQNASVEEWFAGFIADNIRSAKRITAMINYLYDTAMAEEQLAGQENIFSMFADESMIAPEDMTLEDIYSTASDRYFNEEGGQNVKGERYTRSADTSQEPETSEGGAGESAAEGRRNVENNGISAEENNDRRDEESEARLEDEVIESEDAIDEVLEETNIPVEEREEENGEIILDGENDNGDRGSSGTVRQTEEEREPEESGEVDSGQSSERGTESDSGRESGISEESETVRTESETSGLGSDTAGTERKGDSSSDVERRSSSTRFYIDRRVDAQDPYSQTDTQRVKSNIEAIRLLKQIEEEGRKATDEEKQTLSMYTGWGGISGAFDKPDNETNVHKQRREELENLLTKKELNSAKDSTSDAYYTPYSVIDNVYEIVSQLGVRPGGRVLEPSCGIGAFVGCMPQSMREHSSVTAVELDEISGRIAQAIYDDVNVEIQDFGKNDGSYNLIVGNVPFGENLKLITDKSYGKDISKYDIQDGFIAKGLAQLDEGGIMAVLTTHSTMDGNKVKNQKARENFAENANLLGAIRFPANTFSGTDIVTDLLIFQKKGEGVNNDYAQDFSQLHTMENGDRVNQYFIDHPEMVLGDFQETKDRYGKDVMTVVPNETKIIDAALMQLPTAVVPEYRQNVAEQVNQEVAETIRKTAEKSSRRQYDGSLALVDGEARIYDARAKVYKPYVPVTKNGKPYAEKTANTIRECAVSMIEIAQERDLLLAMEAELDNSNTSQQKIEAQKQKLASLCEAHMKKFGAFNNKTNIAIRNTDATLYGKVSELYEITKVNGRTVTTKRSILEPGKRVLQKRKKITHTNSIRTAIRSSMYEYGMIDLPYISKITGKSEEEIVSEFDHTIYKDPVNGGYQSEGIYLSGNVYQKIAELEKYIEAHPDESEDLQRNLHDLESAKPERKTADMITTHLGSPWVSPDMMEDFFVDYFGVPKGVQQHGWWTGVHFAYDPAIGKWGINLPDYLLQRSNRYSGVEWEVGGKGISDYLEYILNNKQLEIKKKVIVDNEEKSVKDEVKTTEALQKAEALDSAFSEWILKDASRMDEVENEFNRRYNNYVAPKYDVKGFTYEGMNPLIELNHHQATGVARATQNQNTLFMHPVGSGKTFTMIATAMEWHRLGQSKKTALICQKNKIMDFENDIKLLYPAAKVLTITDFSPQNRGAVMARIQNEDWDFIVMGYNSFQSIPLSIEYMERYKDEQVSIYRDALERLKADGSGDRRSISSIAKSIKTYEGNLAKQIQAAKENLKPTDLFFEDLGIDSIMVDEAQNYKNLPQVTSLSRVKGVANPISQASVGNTYMHMVTNLLNERKNHIVFATATPVTNTLGELYAYLRYLMPDVLTETGMGSFDGWVKMFAEKTQTNELNTSGTGVRTVERLGTYKNLGALRKFIEPVFDIVSKKDIHKIKLPQADTLHVMAPASNALVMLNKTIEHLKSTSASSDDPGFFLKMYNLAKDAAIDFRLVRKRAISMGVIPPGTTNEDLDFPESKLNCCVRQVLEDYRLTTPEKGVQLIFLDRGMRPADPDENPDGSDISLYQDIINKLIKGGIPKSEIASMSPSDGKQLSDEAKQKIMDQANEGKIRVIIGSSATAGVGINVQTLLYAEHHLDMPDVPANYEQRKGRILRQHNRYAEEDFQNEYGRNRVKLYHYSTSNSQDAARLQMVDRKASMINAPFEDTSVEELEDQDDVSAVLMKMEVGAANSEELFALEKQKEKVLQLTAKENNFRTKQAAYTRTRNNYESEKERFENNIKKYERGKEKASKVKKKAVYKVGDQTFEKLGEASKAAYELFANSNMMKRRDGLVIGTIDGVAIRAREQRTGEGSYGTFRLTVDGIPWFGFRDISMLDKDGRALNKDPKINQPQSIFEIVRNQLEAERADRYIEQFHEDLNRLEANYQDALKHVDETSPFVKELQEAERKKSEMEKALGDIQAPTAEDLHMVSYEDLGKMNGTVRTEEIVLESAKDDQRMAREAAENTVIEEPVEETESPVEEAVEETQTEEIRVVDEQDEIENEIDGSLDDNEVLCSRGPAETTETEEQTATAGTNGYHSTNRTPTRGNFAPSYARENDEIKGITAEVIDSLTDREKASVTGIKSILTRAKALFPSANFRNVHYRGDKAACALGHYEPARMLINTQDANQLGVTMHELGHHLHDVYKALSDPDIVKALQSMIKNVPGLYNTLKARKYRNPVMPKEVFADFVWHYMINPDAAWQMGSYAGETNFYDIFESMLSKKDLASLKEIRKMVLAFNNQDINTRISSTIKTAREAKKESNPTVKDVLAGKRKMSEVNSKWRNRKRNIITGVVNSTNPAKEINRRIEKVTGEKVSTDLDLQYAVESMTIADSVTTQMLVENFVTPDNIIMNEDSSFFDILDGLEKKVKGKIKSGELTKEEAKNWFNDFEKYLRARHGIDWESVGKYTMSRDVSGEYDVDDHESNIKAYEADIEKLDKKYGSLMEETSDALYDWWKQFNEIWMIDTGLVDEEVMRDLWDRYPHYIPMYRVMDNVPGESRGNGGGNTHQTLKKSSKEGSQRDTLSPIENMIRYVNNVVKEYHNNKVAETIHKLYNSQDEDVQAVMTDYIQEVDIPMSLNVVGTERMKERLKKAIEENDGDSSVVDEVIGEQIKSYYPDPGKLNSGVIIYREGNALKAYRIYDDAFYMMLNATNSNALDKLIKGVGKFTRIWSALITSSNVFFAVRNMVRDWQHAYVTSEDMGPLGIQYFVRYPLALGRALFESYRPGKNSEMWNLYTMANDFESKYISSGEGTLERTMKRAGARYTGETPPILSMIVDFVLKLNAAIEAAPRYAQFKATYEKTNGNAKEKFAAAMKSSRNVTVNFHVKGAYQGMGLARSAVPFLNATIQGIDQAREVMLSKEAWTTKKGLSRIVRLLAMQSVPALILGLIYHDDDEYKQMENYLKEGYWLFKLGDTWVRLPRDREFSSFAATPITQYLMYKYDDDFNSLDALSSALSYMIENWVPSLGTTAAGLTQAYNNRAWYGGKIISSYDEKIMVPGFYQELYDGTTGRIAIRLAEFINEPLPDSIGNLKGKDWDKNLNRAIGDTLQEKLGYLATPKGIEYAMDQMTGIIGDILIPLNKPSEGVAGMLASIRNQFVADPYKSDRYIDQMYNISNTINAASETGTMNDLQEEWKDTFSETLKTSKKKDGEEPDFKTIGDYRAEMKAVKVDPNLSYAEKQERITELYKAMGEIAEEMVTRYRKGLGPLKDNYGDVNLTEEAKAAGFTEKKYAKVLSDINGSDNQTQKQYYIASSNLTDEQKQYLSQHTMGKDYDDFSGEYEPLVNAGLTEKQTEKYLSKNTQGYKQYLLVKDSKLTEEQKKIVGPYISADYNEDSLDTWRKTYQPMIDAGWSAKKAMSELEEIKKYNSDKANIVNALQRYSDNEDLKNAMANMAKGSVTTYNTKHDRYVAYAESGLSPDLIDKAYTRHKELKRQGASSEKSYQVAAREYTSSDSDYELLYNVLYMR